MKKLPYQSSLQRPQLLWNDIRDRKLWRGIQWIRRGPTVPSRLSWNAYQSNIPKLRSGVRWKHGMRRFSEYGNVASRNIYFTFRSSRIADLNLMQQFYADRCLSSIWPNVLYNHHQYINPAMILVLKQLRWWTGAPLLPYSGSSSTDFSKALKGRSSKMANVKSLVASLVQELRTGSWITSMALSWSLVFFCS